MKKEELDVLEVLKKRNQMRITKFKELLNKVSEAVFETVSPILKEEILPEKSCAKKIHLYKPLIHGVENKVIAYISNSALCGEDEGDVKTLAYDERAANELDQFLEENYPGMKCHREYTLDTRRMLIEFRFEFKANLNKEDFISLKDGKIIPYLNEKSLEKNKKDMVSLFNSEITQVLGKKIDNHSWQTLERFFLRNPGKGYIETVYYEAGTLKVGISITICEDKDPKTMC